MSYAIIRNEKLTRAKAMGAYKHNERKYPAGFFDSLYANFSYENAVASS